MDKQKQIEEMARIIAFDLCRNRSVHANWGEEAQCYSDNNFAECTQIKNVVDKLYNAGYRKIPEGAVVLTEEESVKAWKNGNCNAHAIYGLAYEQARKGTAEKFAEKVNQAINAYRKKVGEDEYVIDARRLIFEVNEICKEFTDRDVLINKQICDCYHTKTERYYRYNEFTGEPIRKEREIGVCYGTMECEPCYCGGDKKKCDFYKEVDNDT